MKKPMKIIALILLVAGIGLSGVGVYLYYFTEAHTECGAYLAEAKRKASAAQAAAGTPGEKSLKEDASIARAGAESVCQYANQCRQNGMLLGPAGLISVLISIVLLIVSRRSSKKYLKIEAGRKTI